MIPKLSGTSPPAVDALPDSLQYTVCTPSDEVRIMKALSGSVWGVFTVCVDCRATPRYLREFQAFHDWKFPGVEGRVGEPESRVALAVIPKA